MATLPKPPASLPARKPRRYPKSVPATIAKTHLLELLDTVSRDRSPITITKRGHPVATLSPIDDQPRKPLWGCMKGTMQITGDIVGPEPDVWEAMSV